VFIHLGQDICVLQRDIIGIFDLDTATVSKRTRDYLAKAEKKGDVITITAELPKSFIVCRAPDRPSGRIIYLSQISSTTLLHRAVSFE
jgi:hypothetical protein